MHCTKIQMTYTPNGSVQLTLTVDGYLNRRKAEKVYAELKDKEIHAVIKEFKNNRSLEQNEMLWAIIRSISDKVNHSHREEDMMNIYSTLLQRANIKREYIRTYKAAKNILEDNFRAVMEVPNSTKIENGKETVGFWVYYGSSKFNTKEMTELIEIALDLATELGVEV
jgi:GTP-binding protein EngB required for normal cell division